MPYLIVKYPYLFEESAELICKNVENDCDRIIIALSQIKNADIKLLSEKIDSLYILMIFSIIRKLGISGEYLKDIIEYPNNRLGLITKYAIEHNLFEKYEKDIIKIIDKNIHYIKMLGSEHGESIMECMLVISEEKPELILKYLDDIISIASPINPWDTNKYCTMRAIHVLGNLIKYDKKLEDKLLPIILNDLDQWHYRIFNASKRVLKDIINNDKELIYKIETYLNDCENETIKRRAYNILKKVNQ